MKNKLGNVSDMLIEQMERLNDEELCADLEIVEKETKKATAMVELSQAIVQIGLTQLKTLEIAEKCGYLKQDMPQLLLG